MAMRTFGWVQDPGKIENLRKTVEIFDRSSSTYQELIENRIPALVQEQDERDRFLSELSRIPLKLKYTDLVGTSFKPRSKSHCNGILQAAIKGQRRAFIVDWSADNFLRWAHALGFIQFDKSTDRFSITEFGLQYVTTKPGTSDETEILSQAFLSYPPVMRVLNLLADGSHLTKFEIGKELGFVGEDGFTSLPQNILVRSLCQTEDSKARSKMLTDWDGTSDKYARMIAGWLKQMGWVTQSEKWAVANFGDVQYKYPISQAYSITAAGLQARRRGLGTNIQSRISKNVYWEMLATKGKDRDYIRTRRALILQGIAEHSCSLETLQQQLLNKGFNESETIISDNIMGLKRIGLNIKQEHKGYFLQDTIENLVIPGLSTETTVKDEIQQLVDECRDLLTHVPHDYLILIPMSFSSRDNRLFEMKTTELLVDQCGFSGLHLGGANQPDGLIFTQKLTENYGVIIDTKAYKAGFNIPASERDKMTRYVSENILRNQKHPQKWWKHFPSEINVFKFLFVSGKFIGTYETQLRRISELTQNTRRAAITSFSLLLLAEEIAKQRADFQSISEMFGRLSKVEVGSF